MLPRKNLFIEDEPNLFLCLQIEQDLFNKISSSCFQKCASKRHKEADLSLGEMSCTVRLNKPKKNSPSHFFSTYYLPLSRFQDRCVAKYLEAQQKVGVVLQKANEAQLEQQQNLAAMQQRFGS